ncbi:MAG: hypothetical protein IPI07_11540 [Flavobacteriales bacterium]|nr:hypothetical protein [Flavobacteriales bacterium]
MKTLVLAAAALWTVVLLIPQQGEVDPSGPMGGGMPDDPNNLREWQLSRLRDPATGALPADIRRRELAFAATLPQDLEKSLTWIWQGPRDRGGRTRALEVDITNNRSGWPAVLPVACGAPPMRAAHGRAPVRWTPCAA